MKINCKCGRVLKVAQELAGKKIKCKACGQKYRLPALEPADPTIQMKAWKDEGNDAPAQNPNDVGAVALGETFSVVWVIVAVFITLITTVIGILAAKYTMTTLVKQENVQEYADYIKLGMYWGPSLAFVVSGWIVARFSPGRTIAEPAIGACIAVAIFVGLIIAEASPVASLLQINDQLTMLDQGTMALKLNLFGLGMFNAACLSCAGAYFGEVAQERAV